MKKPGMLLTAAVVAIVSSYAAIMYFSAGGAGQTVTGSAAAFDGDTLELYASDGGGRYTVRLDALHAPELHEVGGIAARDWMRKRLKGRRVECTIKSQPDQFGRNIGRCLVDGKDVAAELVAAGLGRACVRYGRQYLEYEVPRSQQLRVPDYCNPE
jgi:endonuclease YncB( thermonuclease family)